MYNTNRLAKSARKAERDGRVVRGEQSLGTGHHPRRIGRGAPSAEQVRRPGQRAARSGARPARSVPGRGRSARTAGPHRPDRRPGRGGGARTGPLPAGAGRSRPWPSSPSSGCIDSQDSARRREARFRHARALRLTGRYDGGARASFGRHPIRAAATTCSSRSPAPAGRTEALTVADSLLASHDTTFVWDSVVAALGRQDPHGGVGTGGSPAGRSRGSPPRSARAAPVRRRCQALGGGMSARATARLHGGRAGSGSPESGERARLGLLRLAVAKPARTLDDLPALGDSLGALSGRPGGAAAEAARSGPPWPGSGGCRTRSRPSVPLGDLRLFLAAETARDSLEAPALAEPRCSAGWPTTGRPRPTRPRHCSPGDSSTRTGATSSTLDSTASTPTARISRSCGERTRRATGVWRIPSALSRRRRSAAAPRPQAGERRLPADRKERQPQRPGRPAEQDAPSRRRLPEP